MHSYLQTVDPHLKFLLISCACCLRVMGLCSDRLKLSDQEMMYAFYSVISAVSVQVDPVCSGYTANYEPTLF